MDATPARIEDVLHLRAARHRDGRGYFSEIFNSLRFAAEAGPEIRFVQDNLSRSDTAGTVRGFHFQAPPMAQAKLVWVVSGAVLDVALDLRPESATFGRHVATRLSAAEGNQVFIPEGFAHGFCTLVPETIVMYKVNRHYSAEHERGILWNDPDLGIAWPVAEAEAILSPRDRALPRWKDVPRFF
jgi:dTDP-4-dehydrorhamnose 3,5-epimerase